MTNFFHLVCFKLVKLLTFKNSFFSLQNDLLSFWNEIVHNGKEKIFFFYFDFVITHWHLSFEKALIPLISLAMISWHSEIDIIYLSSLPHLHFQLFSKSSNLNKWSLHRDLQNFSTISNASKLSSMSSIPKKNINLHECSQSSFFMVL